MVNNLNKILKQKRCNNNNNNNNNKNKTRQEYGVKFNISKKIERRNLLSSLIATIASTVNKFSLIVRDIASFAVIVLENLIIIAFGLELVSDK